jgi:hypothetical protein
VQSRQSSTEQIGQVQLGQWFSAWVFCFALSCRSNVDASRVFRRDAAQLADLELELGHRPSISDTHTLENLRAKSTWLAAIRDALVHQRNAQRRTVGSTSGMLAAK